MLDYFCQIEISAWDEKGVDWRIKYDDEIVESDFKKDLGLPLITLLNFDGIGSWVDSFPPSLLTQLANYEERFPSAVYSALWFVSRSKVAKELFESAPFLFWIVTELGIKNNWPHEFVEQLFGMKRVDILNHCSLPATRSFLKYLGKIKFKRMTKHNCSLWLNFIKKEYYLPLNHLSVIDFELINFILENPAMKDSKLVKNYQLNWDWRKFTEIFNDTYRLAYRLEKENILSMISRCNSLEKLLLLHDQLIVELNNISFQSVDLMEYPKPVISGNKDIVPIENSKELFAEGQMMNHCIYSYHNDVQKGKYSIYKVLSPERATLCIKIVPNGLHLLDQIKLRFNETPSKKTKEMVTQWLYRNMS